MAKISRRAFIKGSCGGAVLLANFSFANSFKDENVDTIIYDLNLEDSERFANNFKNAKKFAIDGDISGIYFDIKNDFKNKFIISGLTSQDTFFVLENIAKDYGYTTQKSQSSNLVSWVLIPNLKRSLS